MSEKFDVCPSCNGTGTQQCSGCMGGSGQDAHGGRCETCKGYGYEDCRTCDGRGQIESRRN